MGNKKVINKTEDAHPQADRLNEDDLDAVAGGYSEDRYDPAVCQALTRTRYECVGFLSAKWCDHYYKENECKHWHNGKSYDVAQHKCRKGCFDYLGEGRSGDPVNFSL